MEDQLDNLTPHEQTLAYADGELDGQRAIEVLRRMAADPGVTRRVMHEQQLREAVARQAREATPATPPELRDQVAAIFEADATARGEATASPPDNATRHQAAADAASPVLAVIGRWAPAAIAALFLISTLIVIVTLPPRGGDPTFDTTLVAHDQAQRYVKRHVACSTHIAKLHGTEAFPADMEEIPGALKGFFNEAKLPGLDLSKAGYEFERIGQCPIPGGKAAHLIYRAAPETGRDDAISLWIAYYDPNGRQQLEEGKLYRVTRDFDKSPHPMVIWRRGNMRFTLVGNWAEGVEKAGEILVSS